MVTHKVWELLPDLTEVVKQAHLERGVTGGCHSFEHAVMVAQMALEIAPDGATGRLAAIAALCHNADRLLQYERGVGRADVPRSHVQLLVCDWLMRAGVDGDDWQIIVEAVLSHDGPNRERDSLPQIILMDSDRLVNAMPDVIMRSGQFYPDLPAVSPLLLDEPGATFREPKSVLRDFRHTLEWFESGGRFAVRLPKAWEIGQEYAAFIKLYVERVIKAREFLGLVPYPAALQ